MPSPARPGQPTVTPGDGMLMLSWTAVPGAGSYTVQWRSGAEEYAAARQQVVTTPTATTTGLTNGTAYTVRVRASNAQGDSDWSPEAAGTPEAQVPPPARPGQPTVTPGDGMLMLLWTAVPGAGSYTVQWRSGAEEYAAARQQVVTTPTATTTGLTNGTAYTVRVRASNAQGDSDWSPEATGTPEAPRPQLARPERLTIIYLGGATPALTWSTVPGADSYTVQWKSGSERYSESRQRVGASSPFPLDHLTYGVTYTLRVRASNAEGHSDWSEELTQEVSKPVVTLSGRIIDARHDPSGYLARGGPAGHSPVPHLHGRHVHLQPAKAAGPGAPIP